MRRVLAVAFGLSLLAGAFTAAPALGATYHLEGVCTYGAGDPFYSQFFYTPPDFSSKGDLSAYVKYMKSDCASREGSLEYSVTDVTPVTTYDITGGTCTYVCEPFGCQFFYLDKFDVTRVEVRDYVGYMKSDCRTRHGTLSYLVS